jgi:hypothetical protein
MFSETSRAIVFNSKSGIHLVQLITRIGVFVPKDSYEFVHAQLAKFQEKVDTADSEQPPETLKVQSSETMQRMAASIKQKGENPETGISSLWTALSQWWSGSKDEQKAETETAPSPPTQNSTPGPQSASSFIPPSPPLLPQVNTYPAVSQPAVPKPVIAAEEFFVQRSDLGRTDSDVPSTALTQLAALSSVSPSASGGTSPLTVLAPLTEALSALPESVQFLPAMPAQHHVGSDMLLRNSTLPANPSASARVFRP